MSRNTSRNSRNRLHVWRLLDHGLWPLPIHPASKAPLVEWGPIDDHGYRPGIGQALGYNALIFEWWDQWPWAGAAVMTGLSRLLVVDVDVKYGGHHTIRALCTDHALPATRTIRTRSDGLHLYYRTHVLVQSGANKLGPGVDIKSRKGLVTAPPTPGYHVADARPIAAAPEWLIRKLGGTGHARRIRLVGAGDFDSPATQAVLTKALTRIELAALGRHDTILKEACRAFRACDDDRMETALIDAGRRVLAHEPSRWAEVERTIRDARQYAKAGAA